jgi:hypothetical protein
VCVRATQRRGAYLEDGAGFGLLQMELTDHVQVQILHVVAHRISHLHVCACQ